MTAERWIWTWGTMSVSWTSVLPKTTTSPLERSTSRSSTRRGRETTWARLYRVSECTYSQTWKLLNVEFRKYFSSQVCPWTVLIGLWLLFYKSVCSGTPHYRCHPGVGDEAGQDLSRWWRCGASSLCHRGKLVWGTSLSSHQAVFYVDSRTLFCIQCKQSLKQQPPWAPLKWFVAKAFI